MPRNKARAAEGLGWRLHLKPLDMRPELLLGGRQSQEVGMVRRACSCQARSGSALGRETGKGDSKGEVRLTKGGFLQGRTEGAVGCLGEEPCRLQHQLQERLLVQPKSSRLWGQPALGWNPSSACR